MTEEAVIRLDGAAITISDGAATRRIELAEMPADELGYVLRAEESFDPPTVPLDENGQGTPTPSMAMARRSPRSRSICASAR